LISVTNKIKDTISHFQDLSASLVSKQSFQQLLSKISEKCNNIPNSQGTIIILNNKEGCEIKHCHLKVLTMFENRQLNSKISELLLTSDNLHANLQNHSVPDEVNRSINDALNRGKAVNCH
jgi:diadenosine tetraphosphate (Ap4A) HIT family hydrolase